MDKREVLKQLNIQNKNTLMETLGIFYTDLGKDYLKGTMSVNTKIYQPFGMLHGGASIALAETLGSCLSNILVKNEGKIAVGTNLNANHLKGKSEGIVIGTAKMIKQGKTLHLVEIEIRDEEENIITYATMTNMIIAKK